MVLGFICLQPDGPMGRFGKGVHPVEQLFQIGGSAFREQRRVDLQRMGERQQPFGRTSSRRGRLAWNDLQAVTFGDRVPAVLFLMPKPVDLLGIQRGQPAGDPLAPQIILLRMVADVGADRIIPAVNAQFLSTRLVDQFLRVPKADGEKLHEPRRICPLPGIVPFFTAPLDEAGPARKRGEL